MIKAQAVKPAQLLPRSGSARTAVIALGHDDAVAGMRGCDPGIDGQNAAVARCDLAHHASEKVLVLAIDRCDERAASACDQISGTLFIAVRHDGRGRTKHFDLMHRLRVRYIFEFEQGRRNSGPPQTIAASDAKRRIPSKAAACWPR